MTTQLFVFKIGDDFFFKHYFKEDMIFERLEEFYNPDEYRFEIPCNELNKHQTYLEDHGYEVSIVRDLEPFCVVKEQYTPYAEILKRSVVHWNRHEHNFFLMKDPESVEFALTEGARRLEETELVLGL